MRGSQVYTGKKVDCLHEDEGWSDAKGALLVGVYNAQNADEVFALVERDTGYLPAILDAIIVT